MEGGASSKQRELQVLLLASRISLLVGLLLFPLALPGTIVLQSYQPGSSTDWLWLALIPLVASMFLVLGLAGFVLNVERKLRPR